MSTINFAAEGKKLYGDEIAECACLEGEVTLVADLLERGTHAISIHLGVEEKSVQFALSVNVVNV